jgi:class 3 adenylate cyclase
MAAPPTGTITFFFTDIQGSTRLWEQYPTAMETALARHNALISETVEAHGGYVFKTVGDAFCTAFAVAPDALAAALATQRALFAEPWGETGRLRVRMALHTGTASAHNGDYTGFTLSRVARILATSARTNSRISAGPSISFRCWPLACRSASHRSRHSSAAPATYQRR